MQNADNLHSLTGKKKKKRKQQPAFWARQARGFNKKIPPPVIVNMPRQNLMPIVNPQLSQLFQAPHHQQESMVDLTDDTSPNTPIATGEWKPIGAPITPTKSNPAEIKITPTRQEKWLKFQESLKKKPVKPGGATTPENIEEKSLATNSNSEGRNEMRWELNQMDDKEGVTERGNQEPSLYMPEVVQGTASEIKLFIQKRNKPQIAVQKQPTPEDMEKKIVNPSSSASNQTPMPPPYNKQRKQPAFLSLGALLGNYPKGVPKSFLMTQVTVGTMGAIQPQEENPTTQRPEWSLNMQNLLNPTNPTLHVQTNIPTEDEPQQYSPSDTYDDSGRTEMEHERSESPDSQTGQKRLSAFQRLGPLSQPKKPKLTINLLCNKDESVREVVKTQVEEEKYTPVHLRKDVLDSSEEIVKKFLPYWPWKRNVPLRKTVTARNSKSVMILEQEQMEEVYEKDNIFIQVAIKGYPPHWKKEDVLDAILDNIKGKSFIPCFIEFKTEECKFLVLRSRSALNTIYKQGFFIRKDDVELSVAISQTDLSLKQIDFIPRLVLRKLMAYGYDGERKLSLKEFTTKSDLSHFIYFPLNRTTNQAEMVQFTSTIAWDYLTDLDLSYNRITSLDGLDLPRTTPKLKHLDLSYNCIERVTVLLCSRELSLRSLKLEGNPLCHDYIDPGHYVRVVKMIFPGLTELDGIPVHLKGELPTMKRNYAPNDALQLANKFLEVFFPLLDSSEDRARIERLYDENAVLTVTYRYSLRYSSLHRKFRNIFLRTRVFEEGDLECTEGAAAIARLISKWPEMAHDPYTFTVDVIHHSDTSTILSVSGILKLTSESLAEDEHLVAFTRSLVLTTTDGIEYKIKNEMLYWDEPCKEIANKAFQMNSIRKKTLSLKLDSVPDSYLKEKLVEIFMKLTNLDKQRSERCLEKEEWNLKNALEYGMKLIKLG